MKRQILRQTAYIVMRFNIRCALAAAGFDHIRVKGALFLGGVGRIMSWATHGTPHWSLIVLMVTELVIPPCLLIWYAWINKSNKIRQDMLQASQQGKSSR